MTKISLILRSAFRDLKKQKVRTLVGIMGVMISICLLSVVLFVSDSITYTFVEYVSQDAGNQDMVITTRHYNGEPENRTDFFRYGGVIHDIKSVTDEIKSYIPRMEYGGKINISDRFEDLEHPFMYPLISGINLSLERQEDFGSFLTPDQEHVLNVGSIPGNHCLVHESLRKTYGFKRGEEVEILLGFSRGAGWNQARFNLTIDKFFDFRLKWPDHYRYQNLFVVDVHTLHQLLGPDYFQGRCNKLILQFGSNEMYDIRDIEGSVDSVRDLAGGIQRAIGLEEYDIDLPKLEQVEGSGILNMSFSIIFVVVMIIGCVITGILINGILKTSVEERIREFGINRTLGAKKTFNVSMVLVEGFLLCSFGSLAGIFLAYLLSQYLIVPLISSLLFDIAGATMSFTYSIPSILLAYGIGVGVGLIVSLSPALKVARLQLIESIHPYRHEDSLYHLQKKSSINYKLIITGIILAANGGFIYFIVPRILITLDLTLMALTLVIILLIFLIGITLAGIALMPLVLRGVMTLFRPFSKKLHHVIKIFVFRYQRRNSSTTIIFALSFSFVLFTSTVIQTISSVTEDQLHLNYGSDLVLSTYGWWNLDRDSYEDVDKIMTADHVDDLFNINGVAKVSSVVALPHQLENIYQEVFSVELSDYPSLTAQGVSLINVDEAYLGTVEARWVDLSQGRKEEAFNALFQFEREEGYACIISEGIASDSGYQLGDKVKLGVTKGDDSKNFPFIIVGIASSLPGFSWQFGDSLVGSGNGVLVSQETYLEILDLPEPAWLDRIFIKLRSGAQGRTVRQSINERFEEEYDFYLNDLKATVESQRTMFAIIDILLTVILMSTIVICIFGLLSSSYSMIIERKKEIGILRTLGLKGHEISRLFVIEALIIMISSGLVGAISGWVAGTLLSSNINIMIGIPYQFTFPFVNLMALYIFSVSCVLLGMRVLLKKLKRQKIMEIFRESM